MSEHVFSTPFASFLKGAVFFAAALNFAPEARAQTQEEKLLFCKEISELAETIMTNRQAGISMVQMIEVADGNKMASALVVAAYEQPRYSTEAVQARTIGDFRDEAYLACFQSLE